jgi:Flp pilus assembly protein TadD
LEKQTVAELAGSNYTPRSDEEREAIATQDMFAQTAFWSREYDLNPADLEAAINLSANLRKMGNPGKSIEVAQHTRALYPRDVDLMTEMSASLIANNQTNKSLKMIDTALFQRPRSARLWSLKGAAMDQLERFGEARQHYTKALAFAPNDPNILANVGLSYALEGDPETAEIWLQRAATLPGASPNVRQNLALVLGLQGKLEEAEKWAKQDLDQNGAQQNLDYIRSLRGTSNPSTASSQPIANLAPAPTKKSNTPQKIQYSAQLDSQSLAGPQTASKAPAPGPTPATAQPAKFGAKLTVAGDPSKMKDGPQTVSEAALDALRRRNTALRNMPSTPKPDTTAAPQSSGQNANTVLNKISQNNVPKVTIAQHQQAQLAQRAAYAAQQRQQQAQYPYPQQPHIQPLPNGQMMINGRPAPMPSTAYNMAMQQQPYIVPQPYYTDDRIPARTRRR